MSYTKVKIYNLALSALMLSREVSNTDQVPVNNETRVLNLHWDTALESTLQELDLDSLSQPIALELIEQTTDGGPWAYVYKYPSNCAFLRRLASGAIIDTERTHIAKRVALYGSQRAIFTNEYAAVAECIPKDVPLAALNSPAGLAVAYKLAFLSAPLIVGKGAKSLTGDIYQKYLIAKDESQETDRRENFNYDSPSLRSEFVAARLE